MGAFYSRLSYSIGNEDWKTEQKALQIQPTDQILCVTASGDRPLNLLFSDCQKIISVDANPYQNALLDLKKAALRLFDYEHYIAFLGISPCSLRLNMFNSLEEHLHPVSRKYWKENRKKIEKGVLYQGSIEKWTRLASHLIYFFRQQKIEKLYACKTLEEQQQFIESEWTSGAWKRTFDVLLHPNFTRFFLPDPCLYQNIDPNIRVSSYLYNRLHDSLKRFPVRENIIVSLILQGKVFEEGFSPYLTTEGSKVIKERLERISFQTTDLISYLEQAPSESFDCFSLSDVASYLSKEDFIRLAKAVFKAAKPGARFCIRQCMSRYELPREIAPYFQRDSKLENDLEMEDRCFIYNFLVGHVKK